MSFGGKGDGSWAVHGWFMKGVDVDLEVKSEFYLAFEA